MSEHKIKITELLKRVISIQADDADSALDEVQRMYRNSEIILTSDDYTNTEFTVVGEE